MNTLQTQNTVEYMKPYINDFFIKLDPNIAENTCETYYSRLNDFMVTQFGHGLYDLTKDELQSITINTVINYISTLYMATKPNGTRKNKNSTINNKLSALKEFLRYMYFRDMINIDLTKLDYLKGKKNDSKSYDTLPMWMVNEIVDDYEKNEKRLKIQKIWFIKLAVETGLRANEVLALKKDNFTPYHDGIHMFMRSKDAETRSKGNKDWKELIHINFYKEMEQELFTEADNLFTTTDSTMLKTLHRSLERLDYMKDGYFVLHSLKRTAVNNTKRFTNDNGAAQAKGKHSSFSTTDIYLDEADYGATGYYSMQCKIAGEQLLPTASEKDLRLAIDNLDESVKMLIEAQLQKIKGEKSNAN